MLWPDSVLVDGIAIALDSVDADVTIHAGRDDITAEPTASTCQLTLRDVPQHFVHGFRTGVPLVVTVRDGAGASSPRFTGLVTDATLDDDDLTAIAAGRLSTFYRYPIGAGAWPVEAWTARVARIFAEAGLSSLLVLEPDPGFDPQLAARDPETAGPTTLGDYLAFLAPMLGAAVADLPDGRVLVQTIGSRTLEDVVELDPADVAFVPQWLQTLPVGNVVTVTYQADQGASVTVDDPTSVDIYGERERRIDTAFANEADAAHWAAQALARGAFAHWNIPSAPVLRGLELDVGRPVELSGMPASSPFEPWTPIVEGWLDTLSGSAWTMALSLSDPLASGLLLPWNTVPAEYLWNTVNPSTAWRDALTLDDLAPV